MNQGDYIREWAEQNGTTKACSYCGGAVWTEHGCEPIHPWCDDEPLQANSGAAQVAPQGGPMIDYTARDSWAKTTYEIATDQGPQSVNGWRCDPFGIHATKTEEGATVYVVDHMPTGRCIQRVCSPENARLFVSLIAPLTEWAAIQSNGKHPELEKQVRAIAREIEEAVL